ncbi:MAG: GntR family transcriptional regulator [Actinomycetales bacterium]|nr:GntR family transcriptional regulator [Actinomycetales bacterium]
MAEMPLYERVRQAIVSSIADGTYLPGDRLPSEARLAEELGVNRLTVRRAIEELARAGVVESRQGSGTYVSAPIVRLPLSQRLSTDSLVAGITAQISEHGYTYEDVLLRAVKVPAGRLNATLELPPGPLWRVDSALVVNGTAWMWSSSWFPRDLVADPEGNWSTVSGVYGQVNAAIGEPKPVWRTISADAATMQDAEVLGVRVGTPILAREGLTANAAGDPVLHVCRRARMDRVSYVLRYDA